MDHLLFIQHEVGCSRIDDWIVLPERRILGCVYEKLNDDNQRHDDFFAFTH